MKRLLVIVLLLSSLSFAQGKDESAQDKLALYKFEFSVAEVQNGKRSNVRNYTMFLREGRGEQKSTRVGNRLPILAGKDGAVQYMDVGFSLSCYFSAAEGGALLGFNFELASLVPAESVAVASPNPVLRELKEDGTTFVPNGKPTLLASLDDINSARTVVLEVTATRIK